MTAQRLAQIRDYRTADLTIEQIAARLAISVRTVSRAFGTLGIARGRGRPPLSAGTNRHRRQRMLAALWRQKNPASARARARRDFAKNGKARKRRMKDRGTYRRHRSCSPVQALKIFDRQKGRCAYCRTRLARPEIGVMRKFHIDHVVPRAKGGSSTLRNLQALCPPCNLAKRDHYPVKFAQSLGFLL